MLPRLRKLRLAPGESLIVNVIAFAAEAWVPDRLKNAPPKLTSLGLRAYIAILR
jgi:hypothetical protein